MTIRNTPVYLKYLGTLVKLKEWIILRNLKNIHHVFCSNQINCNQ